MKKIWLFALLLISAMSDAQQWRWDSLITATDPYKLEKNLQDEVLAFEYKATVVKKFDANGKFLWAKNINGNICNLTCDAAGNIFMTGIFTGSMTEGNQTFNGRGDDDIFLLKMDQAGNVQWLKQVASKGKDRAGDVAVAGSTIYLTGGTPDSTWFSQTLVAKESYLDMFIASYDANGDPVNIKFAVQDQPSVYNGSIGQEIKISPVGGIMLMASVVGNTKWDATTISGGLSYDLIKLDNSFSLQWYEEASNGMGTGAGELCVGPTGISYFLASLAAHYVEQGFIKSISADGSQVQTLFTENMGFIYGLDLDAAGNIFFTGMRDRDVNNTPEEFFLKTGKISPAGILAWMVQDSSTHPRAGLSIVVLQNGNCFINGTFHDRITLKDTLYGSAQSNSYFLALLDENAATSTHELQSSANDLALIPNPSHGKFFALLPGNETESRICVHDVNGKCIYDTIVKEKTMFLDLGNQAKGVFLVEVICGNKMITKKIIVE
ncbi:MAG TPA: T9SS type A sorting domain-containing protein [Bacteroidia bacterium]|jgi:hypothetical protein